MRLITKAAPAAVAVPLFIATPLFITACSSASGPAASATAASTDSAAPPAPTSVPPTSPAVSSGASFSSLTADQIENEANADLKAATSFRVSGTLSEGGVSEGIDLTSTGRKCAGKITASGTPERFVQIGGTLWLDAGNTGMYLKTSASSAKDSQMSAFCSPGQLAGILGPLDGLTKGGAAVVGGRRVERLRVGNSGHIDVTISGTPEYVRFAVTGETMIFSGINAPVSINPPPASQVMGV